MNLKLQEFMNDVRTFYLSYAWKWIAPYGGNYEGTEGILIPVNAPQDYSGMGSMIKIREIQI